MTIGRHLLKSSYTLCRGTRQWHGFLFQPIQHLEARSTLESYFLSLSVHLYSNFLIPSLCDLGQDSVFNSTVWGDFFNLTKLFETSGISKAVHGCFLNWGKVSQIHQCLSLLQLFSEDHLTLVEI